MPRFMLILHSPPNCFEELSPEELQRVFEQYRTWSDNLRAADRVASSDKLKDEGGRILSSQQGKVTVINGPYSEAKEVVGGYLTIRAANYDEAVAITRDNPHLRFGRIEIREVDPMGCGQDE